MSSIEAVNIPPACTGVAGPINTTMPTEHELRLTIQLEEAINDLNIFENNEKTMQRKNALIELECCCNEWIYKKAIDYYYPEHFAKSIKGKLFTFGSYRLGVNFSGADIDSILVVPKFISRDEFFDELVPILTENCFAEEVHAVPKAFVPVLKMKFYNVEIDLLFASVDLVSVPSDFCLSDNTDNLLRNMDDRDIRSVNGVRVTDDLLKLVFDRKVFKSALKIIRIWAKRRCIYSNAMGFLGGVSWAILVARICQLWPLATVSTIVMNFFYLFGHKWPWPLPVLLKEVDETSSLNLIQWDPRVTPSDRNHVMPILTPSYPSQNSTYNVSESHKQFIVEQMQKAYDIAKLIYSKEKPFSDLFKPLYFFKYRHYMVVKFQCVDKKQFREDCSLIESKLRLLVQYLESHMQVEFALIYLRSFETTEQIKNSDPTDLLEDRTNNSTSFVRRWLVGMKFNKIDKTVVLVDEINRFKNVVKLNIDVSYMKRSSLNSFLPSDIIDIIRKKIKITKSQKRKSDEIENNQTENNAKRIRTDDVI